MLVSRNVDWYKSSKNHAVTGNKIWEIIWKILSPNYLCFDENQLILWTKVVNKVWNKLYRTWWTPGINLDMWLKYSAIPCHMWCYNQYYFSLNWNISSVLFVSLFPYSFRLNIKKYFWVSFPDHYYPVSLLSLLRPAVFPVIEALGAI